MTGLEMRFMVEKKSEAREHKGVTISFLLYLTLGYADGVIVLKRFLTHERYT
jgi:hypothetical protein